MYLQLLWLLTLTIVHLATSLHLRNLKETRILGGSEEKIENAPWQISLQLHNQHICGGSIYSEDIILTAAHCVVRMPRDKLQIRAGSSRYDKDGIVIRIAAIKYHEEYNRPLFTNDIAVLRLAEPLTFSSSIKAIAIAQHSPKKKELATVTGWGRTGTCNVPSTKLQATQLKIISKYKCMTTFYPIPFNEKFCAQNKRSAACSGDSGGPLVLNGEHVGIVSFGTFDCQGANAFVDVAKMKKWIRRTVKYLSK